jgi:NAD-dependent deacetylase
MKLIVFTGAGISAESGISTFRDHGGLWHQYEISEVATPEAWKENPEKVLGFYNQRRRQLLNCTPNPGHHHLVEAEKNFDVQIITQNIDDLHERAGSSQVLHLHGELLKAQSSKYPELVYPWKNDINIGDTCDNDTQLRPHVVWFGEAVPNITVAAAMIKDADAMLIVGTSLQVYPAAGLLEQLGPKRPVAYVDPKPQISYELGLRSYKKVIPKTASAGVPEALDWLQDTIEDKKKQR